jgi:hypothetical protein
MKLSLLRYVVVGAALGESFMNYFPNFRLILLVANVFFLSTLSFQSLAAQFSNAVPIRITIAEVSSVNGLPNGPAFLRVGHAAAFAAPALQIHKVGGLIDLTAESGDVTKGAEVVTFNVPWKGVPVPARIHPIVVDGEGHALLHHLPPTPVPCGRLRQKAVEISNNIRKMLGMPLIEGVENVHIENRPFPPFPPAHHGHYHNHHHRDGKRPRDHPPNTMIIPGPNGPIIVATMPVDPHGHHGHHHRFSTFTMRLSAAFTSLEPWEGRTVAFVLLCGLGVLIRMVFVLLWVSYRALHSGSSRPVEQQQEFGYYADTQYHQGGVMHYEEEEDADDLLVPPPQYGSRSGYGYGDVEEKQFDVPRPQPLYGRGADIFSPLNVVFATGSGSEPGSNDMRAVDMNMFSCGGMGSMGMEGGVCGAGDDFERQFSRWFRVPNGPEVGAGGVGDDFERQFGGWIGVPNGPEVGAGCVEGGLETQPGSECFELMDGLGSDDFASQFGQWFTVPKPPGGGAVGGGGGEFEEGLEMELSK